jgi:hypothetical protein
MAALHNALKTLSPTDFTSVPTDDGLKAVLTDTFADAQLLIDSIPIPPPASDAPPPITGRSRSNTTSSMASTSSDISASSARSSPPAGDVEELQKQWGKPIKLNARDNPLGMSVYKLAGKDGKGAWFARRSVHEGLGFSKWKLGLEKEFPETMKVQGGPGEGNIRGIGGERRVEFKEVEGVGKMEVYHLSAQFPGPTTPRDFVTLLLTSDSALSEGCGGESADKEIPRHFMVVSKPCIHPDTPEREGFIRGQYQSVEFIREIPIKKAPRKSASTSDLLDKTIGGHTRQRSNSSALGKEAIVRNAANKSHHTDASEHPSTLSPDTAMASDPNLPTHGRARGKTVSGSEHTPGKGRDEDWDSPGEEIDERESNPVEWIMLTRSDPGGSVPRFMVERGTPGSIVADASKFLDWACRIDVEELEDEVTPEPSESGDGVEPHEHQKHIHRRATDKSLHDYQTNGHLAGLDGVAEEDESLSVPVPEQHAANGSLYSTAMGALSAASAAVAAHTPSMIYDHLPGHYHTEATMQIQPTIAPRRYSTSSTESTSSAGSFASALEHSEEYPPVIDNSKTLDGDTFSTKTGDSASSRPLATTAQEKELQRLEDRKRQLNERLAKTREREMAKNRTDVEKEEANLAKAAERHQREVAKQEEKYKKEVAKLEAKKEKEAKKVEERRQKAAEKDEKVRILRELEEVKAERDLLRKEREILRVQVGELQAQNTAMAARVGRLGIPGEEMLKEVRSEVSGEGRLRANSIKKMLTPSGSRSSLVRNNSYMTKETSNLSEAGVVTPPDVTAEKF